MRGARRFLCVAVAKTAEKEKKGTHWQYRLVQYMVGTTALAVPPTVVLAYMWSTDEKFGDRLELDNHAVAAKLSAWFPRPAHAPFKLPLDLSMDPAVIAVLGQLFLAMDRDDLRSSSSRRSRTTAWRVDGVSRAQCASIAEDVGFNARSELIRLYVNDIAQWRALVLPQASGGVLSSIASRVLGSGAAAVAEEGASVEEDGGLATVDELIVLFAALRDEAGESDDALLSRIDRCALTRDLVARERDERTASEAMAPLFLLRTAKETIVMRDERNDAKAAGGARGFAEGSGSVATFDPAMTRGVGGLARGAGLGAYKGTFGNNIDPDAPSSFADTDADDEAADALPMIELELEGVERELTLLRSESRPDELTKERIRDYVELRRTLKREVKGARRSSVKREAKRFEQTGVPEFEAADAFKGGRPGMVFMSGEQGLGYYRDQK